MNKPILFSVLIPSIPSRLGKAKELIERIEAQIGNLPVEVLMLLDNKSMSIGRKRDLLNRSARGAFVAQLDDDDFISDHYVREIVAAIKKHPDIDVITFLQECTINGGNPFIVKFGLGNENEQCRQEDGQWVGVNRLPFHVCAWRRKLAQKYHYSFNGYGEDWYFVEQLIKEARTEHHIPKVLHYYNFSEQTSEALIDDRVPTKEVE